MLASPLPSVSSPKNDHPIYDSIQNIATGQEDDYTTGCLLDYDYLKDYHKMIATDLYKLHASDADPKAAKENNSTGNLVRNENKNRTVLLLLKNQEKLFEVFHKEL